MFSKINNIGEKTINKIAKMAFASQIEKADKLSVKVKTDPSSLSKGILESLDIDGEGLVMQKNLQMHQMKITLNAVAVNPFKALMGNVQLTQPSTGSACIILNETDIEKALNVENLNKQLKQYDIYLDDELITAHFYKVNCRILKDGRVAVKAKIKVIETDKIEGICLVIKPRLCTNGQGILIDEFECTQGQELSPIILNAILVESSKIFNLHKFKIDGISLDVHQLDIEEGKLNLLAAAGITHLPFS